MAGLCTGCCDIIVYALRIVCVCMLDRRLAIFRGNIPLAQCEINLQVYDVFGYRRNDRSSKLNNGVVLNGKFHIRILNFCMMSIKDMTYQINIENFKRFSLTT